MPAPVPGAIVIIPVAGFNTKPAFGEMPGVIATVANVAGIPPSVSVPAKFNKGSPNTEGVVPPVVDTKLPILSGLALIKLANVITKLEGAQIQVPSISAIIFPDKQLVAEKSIVETTVALGAIAPVIVLVAITPGILIPAPSAQ